MFHAKPAPNALTLLEWAAYVRFMREEMASVSPEAATLLRQAEETLIREAGTGGQATFALTTHPGLGH